MALVWGGIANAATRSLLLSIIGWTDWRPALHLRWRDLEGYIGFGLFQMGEQSVNYLAANVDYLIVGRFLGAGTLGAYALAYQLIAKPLMTINPVLTRVAFPVFAKRRNDHAAIRRGFLELTHLIALIAFPIMTGLALAAPAFVPVAFGSRWSTTASLVPILAAVGLVKMVANPIGSVILAKGRADLGFAVNVVVLVVLGGSLLAVVRFGIIAVAFAYVVVCGVMFVMERALLHRLIGFSFRADLRALAGPAGITCVMGLVMGVAYVGVYTATRSAPITLITQAVAGSVTYGLLVANLERTYLHDLWALVRPRPIAVQTAPEPAGVLSRPTVG
jgi:O-antigen/teichoic acid export membrane protein